MKYIAKTFLVKANNSTYFQRNLSEAIENFNKESKYDKVDIKFSSSYNSHHYNTEYSALIIGYMYA